MSIRTNENTKYFLLDFVEAIGLNEVIIGQYFQESANAKGGSVSISYEKLQEVFPYWSVHPIRHTIPNLENKWRLLIWQEASADRPKSCSVNMRGLV